MKKELNYSLMSSYHEGCAALEAKIMQSSLTEDEKKEMYDDLNKVLYDAYLLGVDTKN